MPSLGVRRILIFVLIAVIREEIAEIEIVEETA